MNRMNITDRLQTEKPVLQILDLEFEVDNARDTTLAFHQKMDEIKSDAKNQDIYDLAVTHFLGEAAAQRIAELRLTMKGYEKVFIGIMALVNEDSFEETEERFRKA